MMNTSPAVNRSPFVVAQARYSSARMNLMLVALFTALNVVMAAFEANFFMLFTAYVPYVITLIGQQMSFLSGDALPLIIAVVMALLIVSLFFVCWIFSKKHRGWMITALVCFSIDCAFLLYDVVVTPEVFIDYLLIILFHAYVMYYLIMGVISGAKLKRLKSDGGEDGESCCECGHCHGETAEPDSGGTEELNSGGTEELNSGGTEELTEGTPEPTDGEEK